MMVVGECAVTPSSLDTALAISARPEPLFGARLGAICQCAAFDSAKQRDAPPHIAALQDPSDVVYDNLMVDSMGSHTWEWVGWLCLLGLFIGWSLCRNGAGSAGRLPDPGL